LTITDSILSGNAATDDGGAGGGIANGGTLTIVHSTLSHNLGGRLVGGAGGIANAGTATILGSTISGNSSGGIRSSYGGGISNSNSGTMTITESTISDNSVAANGYGGGIWNTGQLTVTNSTISGNSVSALGGGIANEGTATVTDCTFSGNSAGRGGALDNGRTLTIADSTLTGNSAVAGDAGGIWNPYDYSVAYLGNTIVAGNSAQSFPDVSGALASLGHNLIGDGDGGSGFTDTDLVGTAGSPIDPLLGPLQDNGGPTPTMALLPGSPALNAGDPDELGTADQRGVVRTGGINIGAYQASAASFRLDAPAAVTAGVPFDVTVTAVDPFGQLAVGYTGTVTFGTTDPDPGVVLPADYPFTPGDGGAHTFTDTGAGETTLVTPGEQTLTVTDTADGTTTGTATVTVGGTAPGKGGRLLNYSGPATVPINALTGSARPGQEVANADRYFASLIPGVSGPLGSPKHTRGEDPGPWVLE
jgi:hypothetical protein